MHFMAKIEINEGQMTTADREIKIWTVPVIFWVLSAVAMALVGFSFADTIRDMVHRWNTSEEYGYGYIIPVITLFLIWQRKSDIAQVKFHPSWWGVLLLVTGGMLYF